MKLLWQLAALLMMAAPLASAQDAVEARAFNLAAGAFQDSFYERAEREFAAFAQKYPASARMPEARLYQARAALAQRKPAECIEILNANAGQAGQWADEYRYWLAQAQLDGGNSRAAAGTFGTLARDFPNTARLLEAGYGEALARFRLKEWRRVTQLLQDTNGTFARASQRRANDEVSVRGNLLLGEALLELREYGQAEKAAGALRETNLVPAYKWRRQYLLCRIQMTAQRPREALEGTTNLLALAAASGQGDLLAISIGMQGDVLKQLGEFEAAGKIYEKNLLEPAPPERRRRALLNLIELALTQGQLADAITKLETYLEKHPDEKGSDVALLTLGELHLRQHLSSATTNRVNGIDTVVGAPTAAATNHLQLAQAQFDKLLKTYTNSPLTGKAWLKLGWCLWEDGRLPDAANAFQLATEQLPIEEDRSEARFKLADAQFSLGDFTNALANYRLLLKEFDAVPTVRSTLFDHALYQIVRASLEVRDLAGANDALRKMLDLYPDSFYRDRSILHVGQGFTSAGLTAQAREVLSDFAKRAPTSPLLAEAELAIARTLAREGNWSGAITQYESWLSRFATNSLRAKAEFNRAWAYAKAGRDSNAFSLFTNFVSQFPTNELAPFAQYWLGNYFSDRHDYFNAQKTFQVIFENTNWTPSPLTYEARFLAGHAAYSRQDWNGAVGERGHFTLLIKESSDTNCPPDLVAKAFFAFGDTKIQQDPDPANPLAKYDEAKVAFAKIPQLFPTNSLVASAWGRIGDCYFQMAGANPKFYADAAESYQKAAGATNADVTTRYQAEYGICQVLERQARLTTDNSALLKAAFDRYYDIVSGKLLREGEHPDPFWLWKAGLAAAALAETRKDWDVAISLYNRLKEGLPSIAPALDRRIEKVTEQARAERN